MTDFSQFCRNVRTILTNQTLIFIEGGLINFKMFLRKELENPANFRYFGKICKNQSGLFPEIGLQIIRIWQKLNEKTLFYHILCFSCGVRVFRSVFHGISQKLRLFYGTSKISVHFKTFILAPWSSINSNFVQPQQQNSQMS